MKKPANKTSEMVERLEEVLLEIDNLSKSFPIVVEGKKDEQALRKLGINGTIIRLSGRRLFEVADTMVSFKKVVILTDFDNRGERIAHQLSRHLEERGIHPIMNCRIRILNVTEGRIRQIEGLNRFVRNLRRKSHSSNSNSS
ncbi:MAG: toprim domain-containing protein [Promethearchaeota archaeon]